MSAQPFTFLLSCDGGGVRGYFTACLLDLIQTELKVCVKTQFDLITGCSTGGFLAALAATQNTTSFTGTFSQKNLKSMMKKSSWDHITGEVQFEPVYDGTGKTKLLRDIFGSMRMGDIETKVALPVYNVTEGRPEIFTSYDKECQNYFVADVVDATSAAPVYFPGCVMRDMELPCVYVDGGVAAVNPILLAFSEAKRCWPDQGHKFKLLSIGTGIQPTDQDWKRPCVQHWGAIQWFMNNFMDLLFTAPNQFMLHHTARLVAADNKENHFLRINADIPEIKMDDIEAQPLALLKSLAQKTFKENQQRLIHFFTREEVPVSDQKFLPRLLPRRAFVDG